MITHIYFSFYNISRDETKTLVSKDLPPILIKNDLNGQTIVEIQKPIAVVESKKDERGKAMRQIIAAFIANLGTINTGLVFGFSAVAIPQLESPDSFIQIDEYQASWVGK